MAKAKSNQAAKPDPAANADDDVPVLLKAVDPIRHDGKDIAPDAIFAVGPDSVQALLDNGAAVIAEAE